MLNFHKIINKAIKNRRVRIISRNLNKINNCKLEIQGLLKNKGRDKKQQSNYKGQI